MILQILSKVIVFATLVGFDIMYAIVTYYLTDLFKEGDTSVDFVQILVLILLRRVYLQITSTCITMTTCLLKMLI